MRKRNSTLPLVIAAVAGLLAIAGLLRATSWTVFWLCIGLLALAVIGMAVLVLRPRGKGRAEYERRLGDRLSERRR